MSQQQPSEEELRAALEEQMRRVRVEDVIVQTVVTLVNLGGRRLGLAEGDADTKDLAQARLAIDAARALQPMLPEEAAAPVRDALSQLQMAFAQESQGGSKTGESAPPPPKAPPGEKQAGEDADRAKARSKIWTPPGT